MKILLVAMSDSIHTARWVGQIVGMGWDVRIFPSMGHGIVHPDLACIPVYHTLKATNKCLDLKLQLQQWNLFLAGRTFVGMKLLPAVWPRQRLQQLKRVISDFQPDIVHSLEFQAAGYLTVEAKREMGQNFPPWIATNWGSDILYFRQFPEHERRIRDVLEQCDYYSCECQRDVCLAKGLGLKGKVLPVFPNTGGFDLELLSRIRQPGPVSQRRFIMLKGYQHWAGRALIGLAALERCVELLNDYELVIHSASPQTKAAIPLFKKRTGLKVTMLPQKSPHAMILKMYGLARLSIGLSLSDGISTSFLEALAMGSFPIQSWTACADEWGENGTTCLLVPPEDVNAVSSAIMRTLTDDNMVDEAASRNAITTYNRLDYNKNRSIAIDNYRMVAKESRHFA